jgi:hypothetical protein
VKSFALRLVLLMLVLRPISYYDVHSSVTMRDHIEFSAACTSRLQTGRKQKRKGPPIGATLYCREARAFSATG